MSQLITLEELFCDGNEERFFRVPDYQRSYSWGSVHRRDLLQDIEDQMKHGEIHFTGTVVAALPSAAGSPYEIVDGQQRLTSLVLLIARILLQPERLIHEKIPAEGSVQTFRDKFLFRELHPGNIRMRLELNSDTTELFERLVMQQEMPGPDNPPGNKAEQNLLEAARQFDAFIESKSAVELTNILESIIHKLGFLFYAPANNTEVGLMFEVINSRGKPLSELDKVKNFLIYYASRHNMSFLYKEINSAWKDILERLNRADMTTNDDEQMFLQSCWIPFGNPRPRRSEPVYEELKQSVAALDLNSAFNRLSDFLQLLRAASHTFQRLYARHTTFSGHEESRWLESLSFHPRLASALPLVVALYYRENDLHKRTATLKLIEKLNFRYYVAGVASRSDSGQAALFQWAYDYFHGICRETQNAFTTEDLQEEIRKFLRENVWRRRIAKRLILEPDDASDFYNWQGLKFFLASYEQFLCRQKSHSQPLARLLSSRDPEAHNDFHQREHILPRQDQEDISGQQAEFNKRRLGNFVLLREGANKSVSTLPVAYKIRTGYAAAGLKTLYQIDELSGFLDEAEAHVKKKWQREVMRCREERIKYLFDRREEKLVDFALRRWHVPGVDPDGETEVKVDSLGNGPGSTFEIVP